MSYIKGQLCMSVSPEGSWEYKVVKYVYDDRIVTVDRYGERTLVYLDDKSFIKNKLNGKEEVIKASGYNEPLLVDGKPLMAKKNWFGKYKFPQ